MNLVVADDTTTQAGEHLSALIDAHGEWFCIDGVGRPAIALRKSELDLQVSKDRMIFSCWTERGVRTWRVFSWESRGEKLLLEARRRMGAERATLELVPRAPASAIAATVTANRRERCETLAGLARGLVSGAKVERKALSIGAQPGQPGRYARVILRLPHERIAVTGPVAPTEPHRIDAFLSSALVWFARAAERSRPPYINRLWLAVPKGCVEAAAQRISLLKDSLWRAISLFEIDAEWKTLTVSQWPSRSEILSVRPEPLSRLRRPGDTPLSEWASEILRLDPPSIDVVRARHGDTLRFNGLAFARVRRVMERDRVWFGTDATHRKSGTAF
jgi:hypothetical protein